MREDRIHELDPSIILQPGPACLTDGLRVIEKFIHDISDLTESNS